MTAQWVHLLVHPPKGVMGTGIVSQALYSSRVLLLLQTLPNTAKQGMGMVEPLRGDKCSRWLSPLIVT